MAHNYLALDVGEKRIGVATANDAVPIAVTHSTIDVDGDEVQRIADLVKDESIDIVVVGYPRNQSGEATAQTAYVEQFVEKLRPVVAHVVFQDESLTSVEAEKYLKSHGKNYQKSDVDALAASLILQDYLESNR